MLCKEGCLPSPEICHGVSLKTMFLSGISQQCDWGLPGMAKGVVHPDAALKESIVLITDCQQHRRADVVCAKYGRQFQVGLRIVP